MKKILLMLLLELYEGQVMAQGDPGLPGGDPDVPLDGGLLLLLSAGAAYGWQKIRSMKRP